MIERILQGNYSRVQMFHARMGFSKQMSDVGKIQAKKLWQLIAVISKIVFLRFKHHATTLYYPPAGPDKIPMYRDFAILICTRWLFKKTIFHFHAGGMSEVYADLPKFYRLLFRIAYYHPDGSIMLSELNPKDGEALLSRNIFIIPYGIEDNFPSTKPKRISGKARILFAGVLRESKGVCVLIDAISILRDQGIECEVTFVGQFESHAFEERVRMDLETRDLADRVHFAGVLTGSAKWQAFSEAHIFCYPTFFESETFGLVVLEAMQSRLPVVATNWRGVPSLVREGETGFIVQARASGPLAERLMILCRDPYTAKLMGEKGRDLYLSDYALELFHRRMEDALCEVAEQD